MCPHTEWWSVSVHHFRLFRLMPRHITLMVQADFSLHFDPTGSYPWRKRTGRRPWSRIWSRSKFTARTVSTQSRRTAKRNEIQRPAPSTRTFRAPSPRDPNPEKQTHTPTRKKRGVQKKNTSVCNYGSVNIKYERAKCRHAERRVLGPIDW